MSDPEPEPFASSGAAESDRGGETTRFLWVFPAIRGLLCAFSAASIGLFLYVSLSRIAYPFELEWTEGSIVDCVQRVLDGKSLYVAPSLDFTCYQYAPLYFWVSAAAAKMLGIGFFPLRLVSFLSTFGTFALLFALVRGETRSAAWGFVAAGLYAAMFDIVGSWFDIARVDCLFLFLLLAGVFAVRRLRPSCAGAVFTALLLTAAYFTKQSALFVAVPVIAYAVLVDWRHGVVLAAIFAVAVAGMTAVLDHATDGWYTFYTATLLSEHAIERTALVRFWTRDLLYPIPAVLLGAFAYAVARLFARDRRALFYPAFLCGAVAASWISRLHSFGGQNVLMPVCAALAAGFVLLLAGAATRKEWVRFAAVGILALAQFSWLVYGFYPGSRIPTANDRDAGRKFIEVLRSIDGEIYLSSNGFYASMAGKKPFMHLMTAVDILRGTEEDLKEKIIGELGDAVQDQRFAAMFYPIKYLGGFAPRGGIAGYVRLPYPVFDDDTVFRPVVGQGIRADEVYVPWNSPLLRHKGPLVCTRPISSGAASGPKRE